MALEKIEQFQTANTLERLRHMVTITKLLGHKNRVENKSCFFWKSRAELPINQSDFGEKTLKSHKLLSESPQSLKRPKMILNENSTPRFLWSCQCTFWIKRRTRYKYQQPTNDIPNRRTLHYSIKVFAKMTSQKVKFLRGCGIYLMVQLDWPVFLLGSAGDNILLYLLI